MNLHESIKKLKNTGLSYNQICDELGCSKSTVSYYLDPEGKKKNIARQKTRRTKLHPFERKLEKFLLEKPTILNKRAKLSWRRKLTNKISDFRKSDRDNSPNFTVEDIISRFGENPICYLTGEPINIYNPSEYHFDHILPVSRGGKNTIDNLGICTKRANLSKSDLTQEEFIELCKKVYLFSKVP